MKLIADRMFTSEERILSVIERIRTFVSAASLNDDLSQQSSARVQPP
jgi:hypothetical protein